MLGSYDNWDVESIDEKRPYTAPVELHYKKKPYEHFARLKTWTSSPVEPPVRIKPFRRSSKKTTDGRDGWEINYDGGGARESNRLEQAKMRHQGVKPDFVIAKNVTAIPDASLKLKAFIEKERKIAYAKGSTWDFKFARSGKAHKASITAVACSPIIPENAKGDLHSASSIFAKLSRKKKVSRSKRRKSVSAPVGGRRDRRRSALLGSARSWLRSVKPSIGQIAATGDDKGLIKMWDIGNNEDDILSLDDDTRAMVEESGLLAKHRCCLRILRGHERAITSLAFSPNGRMLLSASQDKTIRCWLIGTGECTEIISGQHSAWVTSVSFSSDGKSIITGSCDRGIRMFQKADVPESDGESTPKQTWQLFRTFSQHRTAVHIGEGKCGAKSGHGGYVTDAKFSPDGTMAVSASNDAGLKLWDASTGKLLRDMAGHSGAVVSIAFHKTSRHVLSASWDHTLRLWSTETGNSTCEYIGHKDVVYGCCFSPDGEFAFSVSRDTTIRMWEVGMFGRCLNVFRQNGHSHYVNCVACSADGTMVVTGSKDYCAKVWRVGAKDAGFGDVPDGGRMLGNLTGMAEVGLISALRDQQKEFDEQKPTGIIEREDERVNDKEEGGADTVDSRTKEAVDDDIVSGGTEEITDLQQEIHDDDDDDGSLSLEQFLEMYPQHTEETFYRLDQKGEGRIKLIDYRTVTDDDSSRDYVLFYEEGTGRETWFNPVLMEVVYDDRPDELCIHPWEKMQDQDPDSGFFIPGSYYYWNRATSITTKERPVAIQKSTAKKTKREMLLADRNAAECALNAAERAAVVLAEAISAIEQAIEERRLRKLAAEAAANAAQVSARASHFANSCKTGAAIFLAFKATVRVAAVADSFAFAAGANVGDVVEARYGGSDEFFPGIIEEIDYDEVADLLRFEVIFDDGDVENGILPENIRGVKSEENKGEEEVVDSVVDATDDKEATEEADKEVNDDKAKQDVEGETSSKLSEKNSVEEIPSKIKGNDNIDSDEKASGKKKLRSITKSSLKILQKSKKKRRKKKKSDENEKIIVISEDLKETIKVGKTVKTVKKVKTAAERKISKEIKRIKKKNGEKSTTLTKKLLAANENFGKSKAKKKASKKKKKKK
eukprot:g4758.t1